MEKEGRRSHKKLRGISATIASLLVAACAPSGGSIPRPSGEVLGTSDQNTIEMGWPIDRTKPQRLNGAAHNYNKAPQIDMTAFPDIIRNELDLSNLNPVSCIDNPNATMDFDTIASRSGTVVSVGGDFSIIKIKDDLGFFEQYTHLDGIGVEKNKHVDQGDVIARKLKCTPNDTGLHMDFAVSDATGTGVDMERVVFVDALGGRTRNTKAPTNYDGTMILPDNTIVTADKRVCQTSADCKGIINIIPPLSGTAIETQAPETTEELMDIYLKPENFSDINQQFMVRGFRFWLETYTAKKGETELAEPDPDYDYKGSYVQIETNADEWIKDASRVLSAPLLQPDGWGITTAEDIDTVFKAHCTWSGQEEKETWVEMKGFQPRTWAITDFTAAQIENGLERLQSFHFTAIYRFRENDEEWSEWKEYEGEYRPYQWRIKNGELIMETSDNDSQMGLSHPQNEYNDPAKEEPFC
ncbi:MAG: hypothetical protein A3B38_03580 [Candidatus Levybacteria bacterium RIFCSPLOWO2_01_FULL_36_13]|nr:MAG: hypothetical protein A2684_00515 [Candidatus Levybacteria bacterium RIFCSPHIGHO2_01_FULL_36_15b]OGH34213.1 MAG: hypothetical protein A3B38_03580 [Candidatus Levybacteria bacterium RIFCSPLOWO2_01_FULL_36_13]